MRNPSSPAACTGKAAIAGSVLVIGADGQVGSVVSKDLAGRGCKVIGTTRRTAAVTGDRLFLDFNLPPEEWPDLPPADATVISIAATRITECDSDPEGTAAVNLHAPVVLARQQVERGSFVLFLSTTGVFDFSRSFRSHDEPPSPVTTYGRQKAEAESRILGLDGNTAVLRLTKVMGPEMPLLKRWHEELTAGKVITAFHDTTIAPIAVTFAARMIHEIISRRTEGIFHASGDEDLPYTALAEELIRAMNLGPEMVEAREGRVPGHPSEDSPRYTTLDMSGEHEVFGITAPSSRATMAEAADLIARQGPPA